MRGLSPTPRDRSDRATAWPLANPSATSRSPPSVGRVAATLRRRGSSGPLDTERASCPTVTHALLRRGAGAGGTPMTGSRACDRDRDKRIVRVRGARHVLDF